MQQSLAQIDELQLENTELESAGVRVCMRVCVSVCVHTCVHACVCVCERKKMVVRYM